MHWYTQLIKYCTMYNVNHDHINYTIYIVYQVVYKIPLANKILKNNVETRVQIGRCAPLVYI